MYNMLNYAIKLYIIHFPYNQAYGVYAMDISDAWDTLSKNEPWVAVKNINFIEEHGCAGPFDTIH
ncbi:uncharacterized protein METZ01_LOCUS509202 [marine metagenome]|uniref:Uncharacterized protein n=1 Tax=marine metagenome TaxID=408172 RepID=A0A383EJW1_9ZZZZ